MKMNFIRSLAVVACTAVSLTGAVQSAGAATLCLTLGDPFLESSTASSDFLQNGDEGDLSSFGGIIDSSAGVTLNGVAELGYFFAFDPNDLGSAAAAFDIIDESNDVLLSDNLIDVGFRDNVVELLFDGLTGAAAGLFNTTALVEIEFDGLLGSDPFAFFEDGEAYATRIRVSNVLTDVTPIPVPASLPLMMAAMGGIALLRRRKRAEPANA